MKRAWIALGLLAALFAASFWHSCRLEEVTQTLTGLLTQAQAQAEAGAWAQAEELTQAARACWEAQDAYVHITLRHADTDQIHTGFRETAELLAAREQGEYSAANARLIALIELLAEAEQLTWENIL